MLRIPAGVQRLHHGVATSLGRRRSAHRPLAGGDGRAQAHRRASSSGASSSAPPPGTWEDVAYDGTALSDPRLQIHCNRSLTMNSIRAIGFDMDYTLALYKENFERLVFGMTCKRLVSKMGYPEAVHGFKYSAEHMIRGLMVDKHRGNVLKLDRHYYCKVAMRGGRLLPAEERHALYGHTTPAQNRGFNEDDFSVVDTLFGLVDASLFDQLVALKDAMPEDAKLSATSYRQLYDDVRAAVDSCHRDGSLKQVVAGDVGAYVHKDPALVATLKMLKRSGRRTFVATNSDWWYTNTVMRYLCGDDDEGGGGGGDSEGSSSWLGLFDCVFTLCMKPKFFVDTTRPVYRVADLGKGHLANIETAELPTLTGGAADAALGPQVYQGGNYLHVHKLLGLTSGSQCLYVGDHIHGDILKSKKTVGWRTMLVVNELEDEVGLVVQHREEMEAYRRLSREHEDAQDALQRVEFLQKIAEAGTHEELDAEGLGRQAAELAAHAKEVRGQMSEVLRKYHARFNPTWGMVMKSGYQSSRLAHQVERYACLYTSRVTNLRFLSPHKSYRSAEDLLPHDQASFTLPLVAES